MRQRRRRPTKQWIAWKVLRILFREQPFVFMQRITVHGGIEVPYGGGGGQISHCVFDGGSNDATYIAIDREPVYRGK